MFQSLSTDPKMLPILGFVLGLAASLTPCIYPMIPLTLTFLWGSGDGRSWSKSVSSVLAFFFGLASVYTLLGIFVAKTGGLFGYWLNSSIVVFVIVTIMWWMGLGMLDLVDLNFFSVGNVNFARVSRLGDSIFFKFAAGGLSAFVASPCATPVLAVILTKIAVEGSLVLGGFSLFCYALGFSFPLLILGLLFNKYALPRPGVWMVWIKRALGFVMILVALKYAKALPVAFLAACGCILAIQVYSKVRQTND